MALELESLAKSRGIEIAVSPVEAQLSVHEPLMVGIRDGGAREAFVTAENAHVVAARSQAGHNVETFQFVTAVVMRGIPVCDRENASHGSGRTFGESVRGPLPYGVVRIAITHPYSWPDVRRGGERILVESARALAARGHDVTVLTTGSDTGRECHAGVTTLRYRRVFADTTRHEQWFGWRVLPALTRGRFDIVHSLMPRDALAGIWSRRTAGHRTVYQELGIPYGWYWASLPDGRVRRRVMRKVDVYGCMSRFALGILEMDWGRTGSLIPGGVRLSQFIPAFERASQPTILFSAALVDPAKRLDLLLDAVALVAARVPDVRVWLSGPGDPASILAAAPAESRARAEVLPLGRAEDLGERYGRAWVTVLPTETDSFGLALVESLACGTPIVAADSGAPPELVTPEVGAVCRPRDPRSLAEALMIALDLAKRPETVARCRARAGEFDWDKAVAPRLEELYTEAAQQPSPNNAGNVSG